MKRFVFLLFWACCASGVDKYVDPGVADDNGAGTGDNPYKKLSTAITDVGDGDIVYLMAGTYDRSTQGDEWYIHIKETAKSYTMRPYEGTDITLITDSNWVCIRINADDSAENKKMVSFENITFSFDECQRFIYYHEDKELNLSFTDCVFDTSKDKPLIASGPVTTIPTREISFTRCTYRNGSNHYPMGFNDFALVYFDDCALINNFSESNCRFFHLEGECTKFVLKNSYIDSRTNGFYPSYVRKVGRLIIQDNIFVHSQTAGPSSESAIRIPDKDIGIVRVTGNNISYTNHNDGLFNGIYIGAVKPGWKDTLNMPVVANNTITNAQNGYYGTGIFFGLNVRGGSCFDNSIAGFENGIYNTAQYNFIKGNMIKCTNGILLWGGDYNNVWHNSVKSVDGHDDGVSIVFGRIVYFPHDGSHRVSNVQYTDTTAAIDGGSAWDLRYVTAGTLALAGNTLNPTHWAIVTSTGDGVVNVDYWRRASRTGAIETPTEGGFCVVDFSERDTVINNVFDSSEAHYPTTFDFSPRCAQIYMDYNCYQKGALGFSNLGESFQLNLKALQTKWASWSEVYPYNDTHSIEADPQFVDAANGDFRLKPISPCLNAGKPTLDGGYTTVGAWQGISRSVLLPDNCTEWLEMDFNGDCKVDFADFAIFAKSWLQSNLE
jgi:hypothetical protein